jgi:hypothetical protein
VRGVCEPGCGYRPGHVSEHPCGTPHVPGEPCEFCGEPTPMDGSACPDCWILLENLPMADIKGLLALAGLSVDVTDRPTTG